MLNLKKSYSYLKINVYHLLTCAENFTQTINDQKCLHVLCTEIFFESKQGKKKRNYVSENTGSTLWFRSLFTETTYEAHTCVRVRLLIPFLGLWPVILTSQAIQVSTLLAVCRWLQRSMHLWILFIVYRETFCTEISVKKILSETMSQSIWPPVYPSRIKQAHKNGNEWALLC